MAETVFKACSLTKKYMMADRSVLRHLDMEIRRGEIYGFVGANGA